MSEITTETKQWTLEGVLDYFNKRTIFERTYGIYESKQWELLEDCGEVKFYTKLKTDKSKTLLIVFKHNQGWYGLIATKKQIQILKDRLPELHNYIENYNAQYKIRVPHKEKKKKKDLYDEIFGENADAFRI